jgi:ribose-phosphate pyrophosphokinase
VYAAATHGVFVGNASQTLATELLDGIFVTNTIPPFRLKGAPVASKLHVCDAAPRMARAIEAIHSGGSVAALNAISPD